MEIKTIVIDTNAYAEFKKGNPEAIEIIRKVKNIIMIPIVYGELISGFILGSKEKNNRKELKEFIESKRVISVNIDNNTSEYFAQIFKELRKTGKPIPTNDIWICAIARQYDFAIYSYDSHFKNVKNITIIKTSSDLKK